MAPKINHFSVSEMFNNSYGKTSGALFCAFCACIVSLVVMLIGAINHYNEALATAAATLSVGLGTFGVRRFTPDKPIDPVAIELNPEPTP